MFDVVNRAVYDGLMLHGTPPRAAPVNLVESVWLDVTSADADGHWIPAEGEAALDILAYLERGGIASNEILAICPFRDVAYHLGRMLERRYPDIRCGTVHTAQGKEADVVLLVLGSHPDRVGARRWATSQPNLFNVAVSRAKQRLYVVGNHARWAHLPYVGVLARVLPSRPPRK
jgi:superfamily I DNA and/or RNA helicase